MNNNSSIIKPRRIADDAIATVAAEGVARALAARDVCKRELTDQEIAEVSGGAFLWKGGIIAGGKRAALAALGGGFASPTVSPDFGLQGLEAANFGASLTMMG